jgi:hypothetical protein
MSASDRPYAPSSAKTSVGTSTHYDEACVWWAVAQESGLTVAAWLRGLARADVQRVRSGLPSAAIGPQQTNGSEQNEDAAEAARA